MAETLDFVFDEVRKEEPELTDSEAAFRVIRMNMHAFVQAMAEFGLTGQDLPNEALYNVTTGVVEMCEWMAAKEGISDVVAGFEKELDSPEF
jgi:hypothetical protein